MDISVLATNLYELGYEIEVKNFTEIRFRETDYTGVFVLYTSQEDPDLRYKNFIEDILLGLEQKGAIILPEFKYFRAHHNKVFMEILRDLSPLKNIQNITSRYFGTLEEYQEYGDDIALPAVIKPAAGAVSRGVSLLTLKNRILTVRKISASFVLLDAIKNLAKWILRHPRPPRSLHRNKFVVQSFVNGLTGDYKVLVYGKNYYLLRRMNRKNDFRASGSGLFSWPEEENIGCLDFAKTIFDSMDVPFLSLDIGEKDDEFFLIEFQVVMFGTLTLEKAPFFWKKGSTGWEKIRENVVLEKEFALAIHDYLVGRRPHDH